MWCEGCQQWCCPKIISNSPPHCSHIFVFLSVLHIWKQFTAPVSKTFSQCWPGPTDGVRKLLLKMSCSDSYLLAHRLQTLRESGTFRDTSQLNLQISTATHKMTHSIFCSCCPLFHLFPKQQQCCSLLITFFLRLDKRHQCLSFCSSVYFTDALSSS